MLDSAWVGPYLIVSIAGWELGIQREPDSSIVLVHCQDLKKIPQPKGAVSWLEIPQPTGALTILFLGASTMNRTSQDSPSITVSPPDEGAVMADVDSAKSIDISAQSQAEQVQSEDMDVTSAPLISALIPVEPPVLRVYISCVLHPFFNHKLDSGPVRLMTIAHAFCDIWGFYI